MLGCFGGIEVCVQENEKHCMLMNMNMKVGYSVVDNAMDLTSELDPRLPLLQDAHAGDNLQDKVVLLRVDHNVVKKGLDTKP